jgi:hypothetical protein
LVTPQIEVLKVPLYLYYLIGPAWEDDDGLLAICLALSLLDFHKYGFIFAAEMT